MARVTLTADALDDLSDFDPATQGRIAKGLRKLEDSPEQRGQPLARDLTHYRKLVVGNREIRIIYSVEKDGTVCVVWIIAKRANDEVYKLAKARLVAVEDAVLREQLNDALTETKNLGL